MWCAEKRLESSLLDVIETVYRLVSRLHGAAELQAGASQQKGKNGIAFGLHLSASATNSSWRRIHVNHSTGGRRVFRPMPKRSSASLYGERQDSKAAKRCRRRSSRETIAGSTCEI